MPRKQTTTTRPARQSRVSGARKADRPRPRAPGRPAGGDGERVRQKLLDAARQLFLSYEFKAVSVRQVADLAGVNGAMVNYYFGGKKGLYLAMVEDVIGALEQPLAELDRHEKESVNDFICAYMQFLLDNPWWPNFIIREVLFGAEEFRQAIIEKFGRVFASRLIGAVGGEIKNGSYRANLRPELATWSLLGMMVFPFLSRPIATAVMGQELNESMIDELIAHTCELFERGVSVAGDSA